MKTLTSDDPRSAGYRVYLNGDWIINFHTAKAGEDGYIIQNVSGPNATNPDGSINLVLKKGKVEIKKY